MFKHKFAPAQNVKRKYLIPIRARSEEVLFHLAKQHKRLIDNSSFLSAHDFHHSKLDVMEEQLIRCVIQTHSNEDYSEKLNSLIAGTKHREIFINRRFQQSPSKIAFVYSGMGPQWGGMGIELYDNYSVFKSIIDECDFFVRKHAGWSLIDEMFRPEETSNMSQTWLAQPANFALQAGLTELWKHWGVVPNGVVGHSIGETTAFYAAGVHTLEEALLINLHRGKLQHNLHGQGNMLAVGLSEFEIKKYINTKLVKIAAINSNSSITLAGGNAALTDIFDALPPHIFKKFLSVNIPYHGHCMQQIRTELESEFSGLKFCNEDKIELFSSTTGRKWTKSMTPKQFWWDNTSDTVFFKPVIEQKIQLGYNVFVEIGPHKVLASSIKDIADSLSAPCHIMNSLYRGSNELEAMEKNICSIFCSGVDVDWLKYNNSSIALQNEPI